MKSLYLHFPFCETKCHYCDFYSIARERTRAGDDSRFERALRLESESILPLLAPSLETLFLGGGTPSMTACESMARALEPLWSKTSISGETEWTMEANPSSISVEAFRSYRNLGVNRVSMGVQSMKPELLKLLGRVHSREQALSSLEAVFEAGFENVSVDLLCGVPGQTLEDIEEALETFLKYPITHLSCYILTLTRQHRMFRDLPSDDVQLEHYLFVHKWMTDHGFEHYEISNFARPGKECRHNLQYWNGGSYLGLGPSAHSYDAKLQKRWKNVSSLHKYSELLEASKLVEEWSEILTPEQVELEKWMLSVRLNSGFPKEWLSSERQKSNAQAFEKEGLLETHPLHSSRFRLSARGFALADPIVQSLSVI